jgi:NAD(P)-dependent dehydrogenase (short-subunit alcohol dehydrogenase family)
MRLAAVEKDKPMPNLILVTGAAGRVGGIGRTGTELLLQQGKAVRAMVRNEDERGDVVPRLWPAICWTSIRCIG